MKHSLIVSNSYSHILGLGAYLGGGLVKVCSSRVGLIQRGGSFEGGQFEEGQLEDLR